MSYGETIAGRLVDVDGITVGGQIINLDSDSGVVVGENIVVYATTLINGIKAGNETIFAITHNLKTSDLIEKVYQIDTGQSVNTTFFRDKSDITQNSCKVVFNGIIPDGLYRLVLFAVKVE